jgi:periplasmic protein TonB
LTHAVFRRFLLLSLLLHAGVFLAWPDAPAPEPAFAPDIAPLHLVLPSPPSSPVAAGKKDDGLNPLPDDRARAERHPRPETTAGDGDKSFLLAEGPTTENRLVPDSAVAAVTAAAPATAGEGEVRARLGEAVETYFYYPPLARRRGWEGEVIVDVRVEGDGRLGAIDVVSSSGYRVLDNAAVESLRRMARLSGMDDLPEAGIVVTLPVRYLLIDKPA